MKLGTEKEKIEILNIFAINNVQIDSKLLEKFLNSENEEIKLAVLKYYTFVKPQRECLKNIKAMREGKLEIKGASEKLSKVLFQFFKYFFIFLSLKRFNFIK